MYDNLKNLTLFERKVVEGMISEFDYDVDYILANLRSGKFFKVTNKKDLGHALFEDEFVTKIPVQLVKFIDFETYAEERLSNFDVLKLDTGYFIWCYYRLG